MLPPGLLPEDSSPRFPILKWVLRGLAVLFVLMLAAMGVLLVNLREQLSHERSRVKELLATLRHPGPSRPEPSPPTPLEPTPTPAPVTGTAEMRGATQAPPEFVAEHLAAGLKELKAARYEAAEAHFFRAVPESYVHLVMSSLGRQDLKEAFLFLARAMAADVLWFRKTIPRDLFNPEDYARVRICIEDRLRANPVDAPAKVLLAWLDYHDKGPAYARALLSEAAAQDPENGAVKTFLENLDR